MRIMLMNIKSKVVNTVGELKAALEGVGDDIPLTISATGYDGESESI